MLDYKAKDFYRFQEIIRVSEVLLAIDFHVLNETSRARKCYIVLQRVKDLVGLSIGYIHTHSCLCSEFEQMVVRSADKEVHGL